MLEKELSELSISAMFPDEMCKFALWVRVNGYHFRHFYGNVDEELTKGGAYEME